MRKARRSISGLHVHDLRHNAPRGKRTVFLGYHLTNVLFNSLAPGGFENIFQNVFFKLISWIDTLSNSCETALRSMPQNPSDDKSTLVQVMAWCRQAASHYLSQCCPRSLSPYGVTRPQWVNNIRYFTTSQCLIFLHEATVSRQDTNQPCFAKFTSNFMYI